nr:type II toxin-antitoxin system VapC family toxin [Rhodoferax sp.]
MSKLIVLDASAILAFLQGEPGEEFVRQALQSGNCMVTAANHSEIIAKVVDRGVDAAAIKTVIEQLAYVVVDVTAEDGECAGWMREQTRAIGLSLGDRLCLATAQRLKAAVLTADRPWLAMAQPLGLAIRCIRPDSH